MSGTTPNLNLVKPGENGTADIKVIDQNMEIIDVWAGEKETELSGKEPKFTKNSGFNLGISHLVNSISKTLVASAYAVKLAYDRASLGVTNASTAQTKADDAYNLANGKEPTFIKNNGFNRVMTNLVTSTSTTLVASAAAVGIAYNKGKEALGLTVINKNAIQNNADQIRNLSKTVNDVTILWESNVGLGSGLITLSDSIFNYKIIEVLSSRDEKDYFKMSTIRVSDYNKYIKDDIGRGIGVGRSDYWFFRFSDDGLTLSEKGGNSEDSVIWEIRGLKS